MPKAYTLHMEVDDADSKEERKVDDDEEFEELGGGAANADLKEEMQVDYDEDSQEEFVGIQDVEALDDALDDLESGAANALDDHEGSLESMVPPESMVLAKRWRCERCDRQLIVKRLCASCGCKLCAACLCRCPTCGVVHCDLCLAGHDASRVTYETANSWK